MKKSKTILLVVNILVICTFLFSMIYLKSNKYYDIIGRYKQPICGFDLHLFSSDLCEECGKKITESGVFYSSQEAYTYDIENKITRLSFKNYFNSFDDYISVRNNLLLVSYVNLLSFISIIALFIFEVKFYIKNKKKGKDVK